MSAVPIRARPFVFMVWAAGVICLGTGMIPWHSSKSLLFPCYLLMTAAASALKAALPGLEGTVSVNFVFFLIGITSMSLSETLTLALVATAVQCFWRTKKRLGFVHFAFNFSQVAIAITGAWWSYRSLLQALHGRAPIALAAATIVYFLLNSAIVATVVALADATGVREKWLTYSWTFPYYLIGAAIAGVIQLMNHYAGWEMSMLVLPAVYVIYRAYRMHLGRLEDTKRHLEDIAALHMRTIETLALAIEAKDHTTGDHLQRVRVYALELAKDLGLSPGETEALKAASVLHDIGKLAVPEHIISKPGKLTPEEFEKMKIHPTVGAEILEQVRFPYPVAPIVRAHHEKWDGSGYPAGLREEEIPLGARILSAVDCLDALASDRQYRRALPLDEAMAIVVKDSGKAFDPRVVDALQARYVELEQLARSQEPEERPKLSLDAKIERGAAPDAGFAAGAQPSMPANIDPALARALDFVSAAAEDGLTTKEIFALAAVRLRNAIPYDAIAVFGSDGGFLVSHFALGESVHQLASLQIKIGEGLAGWVAETGNPIVNGNPTVEPGFMNGMRRTRVLRSALAVPLLHKEHVAGVLALYSLQQDAFTAEHLSVLLAGGSQLAAALGDSLRRKTSKRIVSPADPHHQIERVFEPQLASAGTHGRYQF